MQIIWLPVSTQITCRLLNFTARHICKYKLNFNFPPSHRDKVKSGYEFNSVRQKEKSFKQKFFLSFPKQIKWRSRNPKNDRVEASPRADLAQRNEEAPERALSEASREASLLERASEASREASREASLLERAPSDEQLARRQP